MNYNFNGTIQQNGQALSGGKIYLHKIKFNSGGPLILYLPFETPFTNNTLAAWLFEKGFYSDTNYLPIGTELEKNSATVMSVYLGVFASSNKDLALVRRQITITVGKGFDYVTPSNISISLNSDTVIEM